MDNYDVVIVGSGIGGLCCGSILQVLSAKLELYSKNKEDQFNYVIKN